MISYPAQNLSPPNDWIEEKLKEHSAPFFIMEKEHKLFRMSKTECWYIFSPLDRKNVIGQGAQTVHTFAIEYFSKKIAAHGWTYVKSPHRLACAESEIECLDLFKNEWGIIQKLGHYYHRSSKGFLFKGILTEYHPKKNVKIGSLGLNRERFAVKIIEIVSKINEKGVIHRDIKPENILIDRSGDPVITDFGFACKRTSELVKNITGTPQFFSPEHFKAIGFNATLNIKDDVWATAVTVHEIFFERYPAYLTVTGCEYISFDDLNKDPSLSKKIYESMRHFQEKIEPKSDMLMKLKKMFAFDARDRPSLSALLPIEIQQEEVKPLDKPNQIVIIRED